MKRTKKQIAALFLSLFLLGMSAGCSKETEVYGKYVSMYDDSVYYEFFEDGTFSTNDPKKYISIDPTQGGTYEVEDNVLELIGWDDPRANIRFGICKTYLCSLPWEGELPKRYMDTTIMTEDGNLVYKFYKDKTFDYTCTINGEIVREEKGTYTIKGAKVICKRGDVTDIYITYDDKVYFILYEKE